MLRVVPNSHRWHNLEGFVYWLGFLIDKPDDIETNTRKKLINHLIVGFKNTISDGYVLENIRDIVNVQKFGEWQLCPKCNGAGEFWQQRNSPGTTGFALGYFPCDVCGGAKIIQRPLLNSEQEDERSVATKMPNDM